MVDVQDYPALLEFLKGGQDDQQFRKKLAWKAFQHVASYDSAVSEWLWKQTGGGTLSLLIPLNYISRSTLKIAFMSILMWTYVCYLFLDRGSGRGQLLGWRYTLKIFSILPEHINRGVK